MTGDATAADDGVLRRDFERDMLGIYRKAKDQTGYNATIFLRMVTENGGMATARPLLARRDVTYGFTALWERGHLELTVEALVLRPKYHALFTDEEREAARSLLREYGYEPGT